VIGYEPRNSGSFDSWAAAMRPHAVAVFPLIDVYTPAGFS
jgi:hypothetical protein